MVRKVEEVSRLSGVSKRTLQYYDDEGMAYKSKEDIIDVIRESVDIREIMKPVYNFKASGDDGPWKKKNRKAGEADGKNNSTKTS